LMSTRPTFSTSAPNTSKSVPTSHFHEPRRSDPRQ
jgi:hypothetical protein